MSKTTQFKWDISSIFPKSIVHEGKLKLCLYCKCFFLPSPAILGFLSNKALLRCVSPFLKTVLDEICPCSSVSIILPDVPTESLSSFTDWLLAGCIGKMSSGNSALSINFDDLKLFFSEWNEIFALLGVKITEEPVAKSREEMLLKQFKHLELRSARNTSDTDMFLTDDESLSSSVCKAAQCDLSAEEEDKPDEPLGPVLTNETVYEDCREEVEDSCNSYITNMQSREGEHFEDQNTEQVEDLAARVSSEEMSKEDCDGGEENSARDSQIKFTDICTIVDERSETGGTEEDHNGGGNNSVDDDQLETNTAEEEGGESEGDSEDSNEEEEEFEEEDEEVSSEGSDESSGDPSWNAEEPPSDSSDEEAEQARREVRGSAVKIPRDLSLLDSSTLSLCLSDSGPIKLAVRCGCRGSCLRNCNCRTAGEECSRWCSCQAGKCRSKLQQKNPGGEFCLL